MLLTKTQKKILEIVREYGRMKAEMLKRPFRSLQCKRDFFRRVEQGKT